MTRALKAMVKCVKTLYLHLYLDLHAEFLNSDPPEMQSTVT